MHKKRVKETKRNNRRRGIDAYADEFQEGLQEGMNNMDGRAWLKVIMAAVFAFICIKYRVELMGLLGISPKWAILTIALPIIVIMMQKSNGEKTEQDKFESIGLTNHLGESPELISKEKDKKNPKVDVLTYDSQSIPIRRWHEKEKEIESAFDCSIIFIEQGKNNKEVIIGVIGSDKKVPDVIKWEDRFTPGISTKKSSDGYKSKGKIRDKLHQMNQVHEGSSVLDKPDSGFTVNLGEGIEGPVLVDLNSQPHMLIGGTTGSGKSVELRVIMWQCVLKGAKIFILDFKGGLEFGGAWAKHSKVYCQPEEALNVLEYIFREMEARNTLFKETSSKLYQQGIKADCKNISDYNKLFPEKPLARVVLACDEIAQVLMTNKSADKEEKAIYAGINDKIQRLAQLSRASGIHMVLATQRPDAKLIDGQIRTNVDLRICGRVGRASESEIVLNGDPIAATISKRQKGRFYTNANGITQMQGYWFVDSEHMNEDDHQIGGMILDFDEFVASGEGKEDVPNEVSKPEEETNLEDKPKEMGLDELLE